MSKKNRQETPVVELTPVVPEASGLYLNTNIVVRAHIQTIEDYCVAMAPGVMVDPATGAQWQYRLWNAMYSIIKLEDPAQMVEGCDELIRLFKRHEKGALSYFYTQRFVDRLANMIESNKLDCFTSLCGLFCMMCNEDKYNSVGRYQDYTSETSDLRHLDNGVRERLALWVERLYQ